MSGTRALFASIGASFALVAAAALSLLAVSAVFAFGGSSDPIAESVRQSALVLSGDDPTTTAAVKSPPMVLPARASSSATRHVSTSRPASQARTVRAADASVTNRSARSHSSVAAVQTPSLDPPATPSVSAKTSTPPAAAKKKTAGDGVRSTGEDLSSTVQATGNALSETTAPLAPPVASAVQKVFNLLAELLRRSTSGLANVVDGVTQQK